MSMQVMAIQAERIKKLKLVKLKLDGGNLVVSGPPGEGKTTLINLLWMALDARKTGDMVVQKGENEGFINVVLGDESSSYTVNVTRKFNEKNPSGIIKVRSSDNKKLKASFLTDLVNSLSFDPLAFTRLKGKDQTNMLMNVANIPIDKLEELEEGYKELYDERRASKSLVSRLEAKVGPKPEKVEKLDPSDVIKSIQDIELYNLEARKGVKLLQELEEKKINILNQLEQLKKELVTVEERIAKGTEFVNEYPELGDEEIENEKQKLADIEEINTKARLYTNWSENKAELDKELENLKAIQKKMDSISSEKSDIIKNAKWPVKGMKVNEDIVYVNDIPLDSLGEGKKMEVSFAIAMSTFPELKCCRLDGAESLGKTGREAILKMAEEHGYQVLMSRVNDGEADEGEIVIEEGIVKQEE